jgi:hypothetical protein
MGSAPDQEPLECKRIRRGEEEGFTGRDSRGGEAWYLDVESAEAGSRRAPAHALTSGPTPSAWARTNCHSSRRRAFADKPFFSSRESF